MEAARALARDIDSPALRELAGLSRQSDSLQIRGLFELALQELDVPLPSYMATRSRDLCRLASELVNRWRSPREIASVVSHFDFLWPSSAENEFWAQCCYFDDMVDVMVAERVPDFEAKLIEAARDVIRNYLSSAQAETHTGGTIG